MRAAAMSGANQRAAGAACIVATLVGAVELVSIYRGSSTAVEVAYFAIPAATAFAVFRTWRSIMVAWVLLTALSFLTISLLIFGFLML